MVEHGRSELSLGSLSAAAHECRVIRVLGDSMEPTLADGCSILVDRAGRDGVDDWRLVSDNPDKQAWPTLHWPDDAPVIGEVRWVGRTFS